MTGFRKRARTLVPTLGAAAALLALAAVAGPAAAHDHSRSGGDDPAGTIASYDPESHVLVVDLAEGGSISGLVTRWTWIDADDEGCGHHGEKAKRHGRKTIHGDWCERRRNGSHGDHGWRGWHHGHKGDESDLVAGAVVDDAILVLKDGRAFYAKVDLDD